MEQLEVTFIDVGQGDSILVESVDGGGKHYFALVDCNDQAECRFTNAFLEKRIHQLKRKSVGLPTFPAAPVFDYVFVTHAHEDHFRGILHIIKKFGARAFLSAPCHAAKSQAFAKLISSLTPPGGLPVVANINTRLAASRHFMLGPARIDVSWPLSGTVSKNENMNSLLLTVSLGKVDFFLTGDFHRSNWSSVGNLPNDLRMAQMPHHGAKNGSLDANGQPERLIQKVNQMNKAGTKVWAAVSCPGSDRFGHPHQAVINALDNAGNIITRTDDNYHLTYHTDGSTVKVRQSLLA